MKRLLPVLGVAALAACATDPNAPSPTSEAPQFAASNASQAKPYIVVFQPNTVGPASVTASLEQRHRIFMVRHRYEQAVRGFAADLTANQLRELSADPRVLYIEPDGVMTVNATQTNPPSWGLDRIDQPSLPLSLSYTYPVTGAGVRFYGIDTGILYGHADFGGRATAGFDAVTAGGGAVDCDGHGTHTASTAAGTTYGVAKGMTIVGVRVLNCSGSGTTSGVIAGIDWVRSNAIKPAVANMSLGGGKSTALNAAVANAVNAGIVFSVSAGNNNGNACLNSPASEPLALTVGSTTTADARSSFSNFGTCVDLFGPGSSIRAAYIPSGSAVLSGTSMSAPHVAGVAGLYLQLNPTATPAQVASAILTGAVTGKVTNAGTGSPNRLLNIGFIGGTPVNQPPVASFTFSCSGLACSFNGAGSTDDVGITSYSWTFGDGSTGTGATVNRTYAAAGTYSVTLTVRDAGNLSGAQTRSVTVTAPTNQPPVAVPAVSCGGTTTCTFDGRGSTDDQGVVAYEWRNVGNKVISTASVFNRRFDRVGKQLTWTLIVRDAAGLSSSKKFTFTVGQ
jgi:subtilisin family serine protease